MSKLVLGIRLYRHVPPMAVGETVCADDLAAVMGLHKRSVQRHLVTLERAGLVERAEVDPDRWRRTQA